jgi:AraC-like DNA-binding protein
VLAQAAALSRSALAQCFTALIGASPMHYLLTWRMQLAQSLLDQPDLSIREVAERVGYESEVAFNRAFKRWVGQPPATWRRQGGQKDDCLAPDYETANSARYTA